MKFEIKGLSLHLEKPRLPRLLIYSEGKLRWPSVERSARRHEKYLAKDRKRRLKRAWGRKVTVVLHFEGKEDRAEEVKAAVATLKPYSLTCSESIQDKTPS